MLDNRPYQEHVTSIGPDSVSMYFPFIVVVNFPYEMKELRK